MAGEIQIGGTTFATESSGTITVANVNSATNRTNLGLGSIATQAADSVSISGGNITGGTIGSGVTFPALGNSAVGTVSESSGTPTGDIIERGSSLNSEYVKYADGTLVCWIVDTSSSTTNDDTYTIQGITYYRNELTWTFPATFSTTTNLSISNNVLQNDFNVSLSSFSSNPSTTAVTLHSVSSKAWSSFGRVAVRAIAVGRWY